MAEWPNAAAWTGGYTGQRIGGSNPSPLRHSETEDRSQRSDVSVRHPKSDDSQLARNSMPGIAGIISKRPAGECEEILRENGRLMEHEGLYTSGRTRCPELGVHAGWVAHEGSFRRQPAFLNEQRAISRSSFGRVFHRSRNASPILERKGHRIGN